MKKKNSRTQRIIAGAMVLSFSSSPSFALPSPSTGSSSFFDPVTAGQIAADPVLKSVSIFRDHEQKVLYVSPSSSATNTGIYRSIAEPQCETLKQHYQLTYALPPTGTYRDVALRGSYSAFFDYVYGNYVFLRSQFDSYFKSLQTYEEFRKANIELVTKKLQLEGIGQNLADRINILRGSIDGYSSRLNNAVVLAGFATADGLPALRKQIEDLTKERDEKVPALEQEAAKLGLEKSSNDIELIKVVAEFNAKAPAEASLEIARIDGLIASLNTLSSKTLRTSEDSLRSLKLEPVGTASASYSIWNTEESKLRAVVAASPMNTYAVSRLPIFNVTLKSNAPLATTISNEVEGSIGDVTGATSSSNAFETLGLKLGNGPVALSKSFSTVQTGTSRPVDVNFAEQQLGTGGSGTINAVVSQAAYCSGGNKPTTVWVAEPVNIPGAALYDIGFSYPVYRERPRTEVVGQSLAFDYSYHIKTDPLAISCTMDISKFQSFIRNAGSSGVLFWKKKWDNSQRTQIQSSGVDCSVDVAPTSPNPTKQLEYADGIRQAMIQDMAADYILNYAKSYQVTTIDPKDPITPDKAEIGRNMGPAIAALCGSNLYCQVGSIVLKSIDEMFGSQKGSYSNTDAMSGKITRKYSERGFTTETGSATTTVSVKVN